MSQPVPCEAFVCRCFALGPESHFVRFVGRLYVEQLALKSPCFWVKNLHCRFACNRSKAQETCPASVSSHPKWKLLKRFSAPERGITSTGTPGVNRRPWRSEKCTHCATKVAAQISQCTNKSLFSQALTRLGPAVLKRGRLFARRRRDRCLFSQANQV